MERGFFAALDNKLLLVDTTADFGAADHPRNANEARFRIGVRAVPLERARTAGLEYDVRESEGRAGSHLRKRLESAAL